MNAFKISEEPELDLYVCSSWHLSAVALCVLRNVCAACTEFKHCKEEIHMAIIIWMIDSNQALLMKLCLFWLGP